MKHDHRFVDPNIINRRLSERRHVEPTPPPPLWMIAIAAVVFLCIGFAYAWTGGR